MNQIRYLLFALLSMTIVSACSNVTPRLATGNVGEKGLHYYMTRPFVVVHKPFPVQSEVFLASAIVSADGRYVRVVSGPPELVELLGPIPARVDSGKVLIVQQLAQDNGGGFSAQGSEGTKPDEGTTPPEPAKPDDGKPESDRIAMSNVTATTDITSMPRFDLDDTLSLVFLPDYDREFVVETKQKLGFTKLTLNMGPGNTLLGFNADVDNSALGKVIFGSIKDLMTSGTGRLVKLISGPTAQGSVGIVGKRSDLAGQAITLRVHRIKMAAQGLYPLVKPKEVLDGKYNTPMDGRRRYLQPVAGYQIPYDYYEVVLFEALLGGVPELLSVEAPAKSSGHQPAEDCTGKISSADLKNWWGMAKAGLSDADAAKYKDYEVHVTPSDGGTDCHSAVTLTLVGQSDPSPDLDKALRELFQKSYSKVTVDVKHSKGAG
jgi:hypothetical protein